MEIKKENIIAAYNKADENGKQMLRALFPDMDFEADNGAENRPIMERVKTFEDACRELGGEHPFVMAFDSYLDNVHDAHIQDADIIAYLKLRIICAALNEGWEPQFTEDEWRWYPWFWLYNQDEINNMDEDECRSRRLTTTGEHQTTYPGFACAGSHYAPSYTRIGSRFCLKTGALATYAGKQFIELWMDFCLIRK